MDAFVPTPQPYICGLQPYVPGMPVEELARMSHLSVGHIVKLASNENPLGMSPKAQEAARQALHDSHRYPEGYTLIQTLAAYYNISPESITLGNGSNDVLDLIARVFLGNDDEAVSSQYAFMLYHMLTQAVGAKNIVVPAADFGHDLGALLQAITPATKVVWIANPNNPTGTFVPYKEIKSFLQSIPRQIIVVLDEAYYEYLAPGDRVDTALWLRDHPNLILVRTFSKIYGLAGLRIGYALSHPKISELLNRVRQPFNGNTVALAAAAAALQDQAFVQQSYQANRQGLQWLQTELDRLGIYCLPSYGNFIAIRVDQATHVYSQLLTQGIIVRPLAGYTMTDYLRVTVGTPTENKQFINSLEKALQVSQKPL